MDTGLLAVIIYVSVLLGIGVLPVIGRIFAEHRPSPYGQSWAQVQTAKQTLSSHEIPNYRTSTVPTVQTEMEQDYNELLSAISQQNVEPQVPNISEIPAFTVEKKDVFVEEFSFDPNLTKSDELEAFEPEPLSDDAVSFEPAVTHSMPDEETMANIESLLVSMNVEDENMAMDYKEDTEVISALAPNDYFAIARKFGNGIADMITATPGSYSASDLQHVMIGRIAIEDNEAFLCFRDEKTLLKGNIPLFEGETLLVKGHFVKDGVFHVMNFEDAETVMHYQEETAFIM
ncbi:hypothetical protein [Peribacillus asahii]|uniref:hypothetical protein n=1 Tax=Peribacillus asahii TaxID=228899 RepID=UPI002079D7CD|nr:hypothetical protein [Peribacillus asahii]USK62194.1 hypothetical protein LIT37_23750 [Peribacillus asahii]